MMTTGMYITRYEKIKETRDPVVGLDHVKVGQQLLTAVCIVLAAGSEIQANLQFNIFSFLPFVPFTGGAL